MLTQVEKIAIVDYTTKLAQWSFPLEITDFQMIVKTNFDKCERSVYNS